MKYLIVAARVLVGAAFLFFGLNILLQFLHQPPMAGEAGTFAVILAQSHWMNVVGVLQVIGGLLLLVNRFVPLALCLLAPLLVNILLFHILLLGGTGVVPGLVLTAIVAFLFFVYRRSFYSLFAMNPEHDTPRV